MNSNSSRKHYGVLPLSSTTVAGLQMEWTMVESPAPQARSRFMNFPFIDGTTAAPVAPLPRARGEKRPLAA
jgi:hypothetical protein